MRRNRKSLMAHYACDGWKALPGSTAAWLGAFHGRAAPTRKTRHFAYARKADRRYHYKAGSQPIGQTDPSNGQGTRFHLRAEFVRPISWSPALLQRQSAP